MQREAIIWNDKIWRCWESTFLLSGDRTHWSPLTSCHQGSPSPKSQSNCLIILMIVKDHAIMVLPKRCSTTKRAKYPEGEKTSPSTRGWRLFGFTHGWAKDENSPERERQVPSRSGVQITSGPSHSGGFTRDETRHCSLEQLETTSQDTELHTSHIQDSTRLALPICTLLLLKFLQHTHFF